MSELSVFIITRNESVDLPGCLRSLQGLADDIVVVDSHSTDETVEICKNAGVRVISRVFDGFGAQKQFALDQTRHSWVLSIDADERVTPELAYEIKMLLRADPPHAGYKIRRQFHFLGKRLRFGGVGTDWVLRLFRKDLGYFKSFKVHERVEVRGSVGELEHALEHYSYPTLEEYVEKCNHYTTLAAQELRARGRRFSIFDHLRPAWELFSRVILKGAWLDGHAGLTYAALSSHAAWLRAIKLKQLEESALFRPTSLPKQKIDQPKTTPHE